MKRITLLILVLGLALLAGPAYAQTETPPQGDTAAWTGEVTGELMNLTENGLVDGTVEIMLHSWGPNLEDKLMLHGETSPDGSFRFEEVPFEVGDFYSVMASFQGATYFSDPLSVNPEQAALNVEVPVYNTKSDPEGIQIDQMHILFYPSQGGLGVTEVYILSNLSDYTVRDAVKLEEATSATLKFSLPEEAANVTFNTRNQERFSQVAGGFVDTQPLVPGEGSSQIMVSYILPYDDALSYDFSSPLETLSVNFLIDASSGVTLEGENLESRGTQSMQDGTTFNIFQHGAIQPGETAQVTLSGKPTAEYGAETSVAAEPASSSLSPQSIAVGGVVLGLALMGVGFWWFKNQDENEIEPIEEDEFDSLAELLNEIASLDRAREEGLFEEEEYKLRRAELRQEARNLLAKEIE